MEFLCCCGDKGGGMGKRAAASSVLRIHWQLGWIRWHKPSSKHGRPATPPSPLQYAPLSSPAANGVSGGEAPAISEAHDMAAIGPPPKLGEFYDFFSFAHLTPPLHYKERNGAPQDGDYFEIEQNLGQDEKEME